MRTSTEIQAQINAIRTTAKDDAYNRMVNEGGYGARRDSVPAALWAELNEALAAEFRAEWTLEVLQARRAEINAAVKAQGARNFADVTRIAAKLGHDIRDINRAKDIHGVA